MSHTAVRPVPSSSSARPETRERVSVVVPVAGRIDELVDVHAEFAGVLEEAGEEFEFVFVFDASHTRIPAELRERARRNERIRLLALTASFGETAALRAGIERSEGAIIATLPAAFEVEPGALTAALRTLRGSPDVVVARRPRPDGWLQGLKNRTFRFLARGATGTSFTDMSCGLRVMRREVALSLPLRGNAHRFFPAVAATEGYRVQEIDVRRHRRELRRKVRSPADYVGILLDLLAFLFLSRFTDRPLRFFGAVGSALVIGGVATGAWLTFERFVVGKGIANRPLLLLSVLLVAVGVQVVGLGLVGEIIVSHGAPGKQRYRVRDVP